MVDLSELKRVTRELNDLNLCLDVVNKDKIMTDRNPKKRYKGGWEQYPPDFDYPTRTESDKTIPKDARVNIRKRTKKSD